MMLRRLVTMWLHQTTQEKIHEAVSEATAGSRDRHPSGETNQTTDTPESKPPPCTMAFIFALGVESGGLVDLLTERVTRRRATFVEHSGYLNGQPVVLAESGLGHLPAARATRDVIAIHQPPWVVSAGFACALTKSLQRGHVLMADEVVNPRGDRLSIELNIDRNRVNDSPGLHVGRLLTVDHLVRTPAARHKLGDQYHALACDMETMAVGQVCQSENVRVLSVRLVSDAVDDQLPVEVEQLLEQDSLAAKLGAAAGALFKRPSSVKDMWQLKEDALKASDRLARFLTGVATQL